MPQKHSKNNGSGTYGVFSHGERRQCEFMASLEARCGSDSQLPFGWCALSLRPATDPVCTPSGHVYSRECLLEHMVTKGAELKHARELYDAEVAADARAAAESRDDAVAGAITDFERSNDPLVNGAAAAKRRKTDAPAHSASNFMAPLPATSQALIVADFSKKVDFGAKAKFATDLARTSPWLPSFTPEAAPRKREAPPRRPPSPITGAQLRAKDLVALDLKRSDGAKASGNANDGLDSAYLCHVSGDEITNQPVLLIKTTGCVMLEPVAKRLGVLKSKRCPITGAAFKTKDVLSLATAVSGYAASGGAALKVKVHRANGGGA